MSQENIEIVRRIYAAVNGGDWDAISRDLHEDIEMETQRSGSFRGRSDMRRFFEEQTAAFESVVGEPEETFDTGDQVVVFVRVSARPTGSTAAIEARIGHLWTIRDRAAVSLRTFPRRHDALEAAGLSE